jgi:hypothetical protein
VVVSPILVTAGQPTRESLLQLKAEGNGAFIDDQLRANGIAFKAQ